MTDANADLIIAKLDAIATRQGDIASRQSEMASTVGRMDDRVNDLSQSLINHINSDVSNNNKKTLKSTPPWILILLVFFLGRLSINLADMYDRTQQQSKLPSQQSSFAPANSTLVDDQYIRDKDAQAKKQKQTTNQRINKRLVETILGKEDE